MPMKSDDVEADNEAEDMAIAEGGVEAVAVPPPLSSLIMVL